MEKRLTALKIINAAGLMSLVLFAVCWQPGVTVATKGLETETVAQPAERNFSIRDNPQQAACASHQHLVRHDFLLSSRVMSEEVKASLVPHI
jgi:hypothetical protein